jgi:hypothetical protein
MTIKTMVMTVYTIVLTIVYNPGHKAPIQTIQRLTPPAVSAEIRPQVPPTPIPAEIPSEVLATPIPFGPAVIGN